MSRRSRLSPLVLTFYLELHKIGHPFKSLIIVNVVCADDPAKVSPSDETCLGGKAWRNTQRLGSGQR